MEEKEEIKQEEKQIEEEKEEKKDKIKKKILKITPFKIFLLIVIIGVVAIKFSTMASPGKETIVTKSTLMDAVNISDLSSAKFTYNGVAEFKQEGFTANKLTYISYKATVNAGIDMSKIEFDIDEENKIVTAILPEIELTPTVLTEESLGFIPTSSNISISDALSACEKDVKEEANASKELKDTAKENMESIVESLTCPILEAEGYSLTFEWK